MATVNYTCPNCAAPLKFNPDKQMFSCEYCMILRKSMFRIFLPRRSKKRTAQKSRRKRNRKRLKRMPPSRRRAMTAHRQKTKLKKRLLSTTAQVAVLRLLQQRQLRQQPASIVRILLFSAADFRVNLNPTV
jgi:uncharacterized Zn finger protein (UPF0148 family)